MRRGELGEARGMRGEVLGDIGEMKRGIVSKMIGVEVKEIWGGEVEENRKNERWGSKGREGK